MRVSGMFPIPLGVAGHGAGNGWLEAIAGEAGGDHRPAIDGWVKRPTNQPRPCRDERNGLPSRAGLGNLDGGSPSTQVLGYFQQSCRTHSASVSSPNE